MAEKMETIEENIVPVLEAPASEARECSPMEPKKKGRPAGAKDRAPRKKKINIVEEPLVTCHTPKVQEIEERAPSPDDRSHAAPVAREQSPQSEPDSPRTELINAQRKFHNSRYGSESKQARAHDRYAKNLASLHQFISCG